MTGSLLVLCGRHPQPVDIALFTEKEHATFSAGVPTIAGRWWSERRG
jgi:hypothetical protein